MIQTSKPKLKAPVLKNWSSWKAYLSKTSKMDIKAAATLKSLLSSASNSKGQWFLSEVSNTTCKSSTASPTLPFNRSTRTLPSAFWMFTTPSQSDLTLLSTCSRLSSTTLLLKEWWRKSSKPEGSSRRPKAKEGKSHLASWTFKARTSSTYKLATFLPRPRLKSSFLLCKKWFWLGTCFIASKCPPPFLQDTWIRCPLRNQSHLPPNRVILLLNSHLLPFLALKQYLPTQATLGTSKSLWRQLAN